MSMYQNMKRSFQNEYKERNEVYRRRLVTWRSEPPIFRVAKPTNIARARELGYRAKEGILVARVRVKGGTKKRAEFGGGRKPSKSGRYLSISKSLQSIAEERASRRFSNCEVLNSYFVGSGGSDKFFEVIMLDRASHSIAADNRYNRMTTQTGRAYRGLTQSGRKHRGVATRGYGTIRRRPSKRSNLRS